MYLNFYGLNEKPFNLFADPDYLYLSSQHKAALTHLDYGLTDQSGFIVITGDVGTGKTTLLKFVIRNLDESVQAAMIFNTGVTPLELIQMILREFDIYEHPKDKSQCYQSLYDFLLDQFAVGSQCLLFIDEAQNLSPQTLEEIRMLSNLNEGKDTLLQIILAGQPALRLKLEHKSMRQFAQRITLDFVLKPLDQTETRHYILHRTKVAGRDHQNDLFTSDACGRVYEASGGIPRLINILCDEALVYGFADELTAIDATVINEVLKGKKIKGQFRKGTPPEKMPGHPAASGALAQRLTSVSQRLEALGQQIAALQENGHDQTIRKLEGLLADENKKVREAIHECGQKDAVIKMLKRRADRLEKLLRAHLKKRSQDPAERP